MTRTLRLLAGTKKGLFVLESDADRASWSVNGPYCEHWPINHAVADPATGTLFAGGGNPWFGPAVWKSDDWGRTWSHSSDGLSYGEGADAIASVWSLAAVNGHLYAGVEPAGLFRSDDGGASWTHMSGLRDHPSRADWQPGGGGLILHSILAHPDDPDRIWIAISTAGVFHTADGGATWEPRNRGTRMDFMPEDQRYGEYGQCVHSIALAAGMPDRLYQQNHCGMYRSDDGGREWTSIEDGLPSSFGFPSVAHPRDPDTLYLFPLNGDIAGRYAPDAKAAVWRTRDAGATWQDLRNGLPQENAYVSVLRQAMTADSLDPAGIYVGTQSGVVYASADEGETWTPIVEHLPLISSLEVVETDD